MRGAVALLMVLLFGGAGAAAPQSAQAASGMAVEDPAGDAYEWTTEWATMTMPCATVNDAVLPQPLPIQPADACTAAHDATWAENRTGVVPAAPALDLLGVELSDDAGILEVAIVLAEIPEDYAGLVDAEQGLGSVFVAAFTPVLDTQCVAGVAAYAFPAADGASMIPLVISTCLPDADPSDIERSACSKLCAWATPMRIETGTPGRLVFDVPRTLLHQQEAGDTMHRVFAYTERMLYHPQAGFGVQASGNLQFEAVSPFGTQTTYRVDETATGEATMTTAASGEAIAWQPMGVDVDLLERTPRQRPDLDILATHFVETDRRFVLEATLASVDETPAAHILEFHMDPAATDVRYRFGYSATDGERRPYLTQTGSQIGPPLAFVIEVEPGSPGRVRFIVERDQLPEMEAGTPLGLLYSITMPMPVDESLGVSQATTLGVSRTDVGDVSAALPPYFFRYSSTPTYSPGLRLVDLSGDVSLEAAPDLNAIPFDSGPYDIQQVDVVPTAHAELTVTMGLPTAALEVPPTYDGALHAIGFQTARGDFMVGHYQLAGSATGDFFCMPDPAVFTEGARDPFLLADRWINIPGRVLEGASAGALGGGTEGGAGGFVMFAPLSCLGILADADLVEVADVRGVTFLFRNPTGRPGQGEAVLLDEVANGAPTAFAMPALPIATVATSPWATPFGVQNFWDIFGVAIAVALALASLLVVARRRARMKRYLVNLEELADHFHDKPEAYAQELVALRRRLYDDLLRNRLTEGHFVMVEERLRSSLSGTRINAFGRSFYDLPPALIIRLQTLLADGRFSAQDHTSLTELVAGLRIPAASRSDVRSQLALWASQDAEVARISKARRARRRRIARLLTLRWARVTE